MATSPRSRAPIRIEGLPIIVVSILIIGVFMYTAPSVFLRPEIYTTTLLSTVPPIVLLATGLTFVIGAGEIDLSFPSVIGFSGCAFAILFKEYQLGWIAVIAAFAAGILIGFINGVLVAKVGIPSFIATLGTSFFWNGMATYWSGGKSYALRGVEDSSVWQVIVGRLPIGDPSTYAWYTQISVQSIWAALIVVFLWFILNRHRFGEHILFIGDSNDVSRVVGINVDREKIKLFTLMGALAAVAAVMLTLEDRNYYGNQGQGYLLVAIASVLIGGTSIFGGKATIIGTVFGAVLIYLMEPGLVAAGATAETVQIMRGLVFLMSVVFYLFMEEPARRRALLSRFRIKPSSGPVRPAGERPAQPTHGP
ncbi:MAG: ABC transporter permease [Methylobacteriaceae bacterium]|nr:ABC transporter permease [Methylobacteriaceae bacterium]